MLQSVSTQTTYSVLIAATDNPHNDDLKIVYVNEAFTKISDNSKSKMIDKSPRILQGKKTDASLLERLRIAFKENESCEADIISYKKMVTNFGCVFLWCPLQMPLAFLHVGFL